MPNLSTDSTFSNDQPSDSLPNEPIETVLEAASLAKGIAEFNSEQFYACHDTLEAVWMAAENADKPFYQGILQISVAFYHLGNLNWRGGAILLGEGIGRLRKFEPACEGVDVEGLVDEAVEWLSLVQTAGPEGVATLMAELPRSLPKIRQRVFDQEAAVGDVEGM